MTGTRADRVVGTWVFVTLATFMALAGLVAAEFRPVVAADEAIARWLSRSRSEWATDLFEIVTLAGSRWVIGASLVALSVWVIRTGRCRWILGVLLAAFVVNPLLEMALKTVVDRDRPLALSVAVQPGASFPSGHVLAAVGFYGVLAALIWRSTPSRRLRRAGGAAAAVIIGLVATSRLYLGVHWASDVLAGLLIGSVYVGTVAWAFGDHHLGSHSCFRARRAPASGKMEAT